MEGPSKFDRFTVVQSDSFGRQCTFAGGQLTAKCSHGQKFLSVFMLTKMGGKLLESPCKIISEYSTSPFWARAAGVMVVAFVSSLRIGGKG